MIKYLNTFLKEVMCTINDHYKTIRNFWHNFSTSVKSVKYWFKVVWEDRYWDHVYLFTILHHKLKQMEKELRKNELHESSIKDADNIKICVDALERLIDDNYSKNDSEEHDKKWGELTMKECQGHQGGAFKFERENVKTSIDQQKESAEFLNIQQKAEDRKHEDLATVCDTIKKEAFRWWD